MTIAPDAPWIEPIWDEQRDDGWKDAEASATPLLVAMFGVIILALVIIAVIATAPRHASARVTPTTAATAGRR